MSITFVKEVGEAQSKVSTHSNIGITVPAAGVAVGNVLAVALAMDATAGAASVTDTPGNTYVAISTVTNASHARSVLWLALVTRPLVSGNSITVSHPAVVASAIVVGEFNNVSLTISDLAVTTTPNSTAHNAGNNFPVNLRDSLVVVAHALETPDEALTATAGTTKVGDLGTTGSTAATNILAGMSFIIATASSTGIAPELNSAGTVQSANASSGALSEAGNPHCSQDNSSAAPPADNAGIGTVAWTNPGNARLHDTSRATITLIATQNSHYLLTRAHGFAIPDGATIVGIQVDVECYEDTALLGQLLSARLAKAGTVQTGTTYTADFPDTSGAEAYVSFGGPTDMWGNTWTEANIEDATFGVALFVANAVADTYNVNHIRISVYYATSNSLKPRMKQVFQQILGR